MNLYKAINPNTGKFITGTPLWIKGRCYLARKRDKLHLVAKLKNEINPLPCLIEVLPTQVCECTGKMDSRIRLIWSHDLVRIEAKGKTFDGITGVVIYNRDFASWCIAWDFEFGDAKAMITFQDCYEGNVKIEVVGNIAKEGFRNPQDWYDELCRQEYSRRMKLTEKYNSQSDDDLPF